MSKSYGISLDFSNESFAKSKRSSLKKNIQYDTIIRIESIRTKRNNILSKYRKTISFV